MSKRIRISLAGATVLIAAGLLLAQPGPGPGGRRGPGPGMGPQGGAGMPTKPPVAKNAAEKAILDVLDDMDRNQRGGNMNVPIEDGRLLRLLAEIHRGKAHRRDRHIERLLGNLAVPGPQGHRRQADHL